MVKLGLGTHGRVNAVKLDKCTLITSEDTNTQHCAKVHEQIGQRVQRGYMRWKVGEDQRVCWSKGRVLICRSPVE